MNQNDLFNFGYYLYFARGIINFILTILIFFVLE